MRRNAERDLAAEEEWKRRKAQRTLDQFDVALAAALPEWINKLLAKPENSRRDFKIMRAHRRGLLRMEGITAYPSHSVWKETAHRIRIRDEMRCAVCGATDITLDVHHIVYLSKHGTNQQGNLITLCRPCHEREHDKEFDLGEIENTGPVSTIAQADTLAKQTSAPVPRTPEQSFASEADHPRTGICCSQSNDLAPLGQVIKSSESVSSSSLRFDSHRTMAIKAQSTSVPIRAENLLPRQSVKQTQPSSKIVRRLLFFIVLIAVIVAVFLGVYPQSATAPLSPQPSDENQTDVSRRAGHLTRAGKASNPG